MTKLGWTVLGVAGVGATITMISVGAMPPPEKVAICHQANGNVVVLELPDPAVEAHLAHGDYILPSESSECVVSPANLTDR